MHRPSVTGDNNRIDFSPCRYQQRFIDIAVNCPITPHPTSIAQLAALLERREMPRPMEIKGAG